MMRVKKIFSLLLGIALLVGTFQTWANSHAISQHSVYRLAHTSAETDSVLSVNELVNFSGNQWDEFNNKDHSLSVAEGVNWYKLTLANHNFSPSSVFFTLSNSEEIESVDLFFVDSEKKAIEQPLSLAGNNLRFKHLMVNSDSVSTFYLAITAESDVRLVFSLLSPDAFHQMQTNDYWLKAFVIGGIIFTAVIFGFLYTATYDKSLGLLSMFFLSRGLLLLVLTGGHLLFLFPENESLRGSEFPWLVSASSVFYLLFTAHFFNLRRVFKQGLKALKVVCLLLLAYVPISLFLSVSVNVLISSIIMSSVMLILMLLGLYLHQRKQRLALMLFAIMAVQLVFTLLIIAGFYVDIAWFYQRNDLHLISFSLNTILIVLMMCRMYGYQLLDKEKAQKEALANAISSREAQEKLLQLQADNQEELEQRVQERTLELNIALNELEELNRELEEKNTIDELTGLYNRRFYDQKILAEFRRSKRNLTSLSLVVADLDFFKKVNDTYGHLAGDQCLSWLAQHIKQSLKRSTDMGCRYGGEEFCLILPDTDPQGAIALAEELRRAVESFDFVYQGQHLSLTISCGVTTYHQQDGVEPEHIFYAADKALYQAKRNGRNQVVAHEITRELLNQEH